MVNREGEEEQRGGKISAVRRVQPRDARAFVVGQYRLPARHGTLGVHGLECFFPLLLAPLTLALGHSVIVRLTMNRFDIPRACPRSWLRFLLAGACRDA